MTQVTNIIWDTEDNGEIVDVNLPDNVCINEDIDEDEIVDWLSDNYGFCVKSFSEIRR